MAQNTYDSLGQLISKNVGDIVGATPLQKVDYTYNIRGWLTGINKVVDGSNQYPLNQTGEPNDLFAFKINYNTIELVSGYSGGKALYNGNISETYWRTNSDNSLRKYSYNYDHLNRMTSAVYLRPESGSLKLTNMYNEAVSYDLNGNIQTLQRNGDFDSQAASTPAVQIDNLVYSYKTNNPNQLENVLDNSAESIGFNDGNKAATTGLVDFEYDTVFGNLTVDRNKKIATIKYNHLNLPTEIIFSPATPVKKINYIYNAAGVKIKKVITSGTTVSTTDYLGGYQYYNTILQHFPHAEGYVNFDAGEYKHVFNYTDHLGNIRLSYTKNNVTGLPIIMEENHYYPFGLKHTNYNVNIMKLRGSTPEPAIASNRKYRFGGKEFQDNFAINMYDFGARNYDPAIGRWMNIDPLAELGRRWSPYVYAFNNPNYFTDPDGMWGEGFQSQVDRTHEMSNDQWLAHNRPSDSPTAQMDAEENNRVARQHNSPYPEDEEESNVSVGELEDGGVQEDPPSSFWEWLDRIISFPKSNNEAEERNSLISIFYDVTNKGIEVGSAWLGALSTFATLPFGGEGSVVLESKAGYTVIKESSTKYSVYLETGSAREFYKTLYPKWNEIYQYTKGAFSTTSFTTNTGTRVILNTTSKSTGQASVKIIEKSGTQILFRFPK